MYRLILALLISLAGSTLSHGQGCLQGLRPSSNSPSTGEAVALSTDWAAVAEFTTTSVPGTSGFDGVVYLYRRGLAGGDLEPAIELWPTDPTGSDFFGWDLDLFESTLAVGAPLHDLGLDDQVGAVYLFEEINGQWTSVEKVRPPAPMIGHAFGAAVDVTNHWLAVRCLNRPELYIYRRTPVGAVLHSTIVLSGDLLSTAPLKPGRTDVRVAGDHLAVAGGGAARVYAYQAAQDAWVPVFDRSESLGLLGFDLGDDGFVWGSSTGIRFVPRDTVTGSWGTDELVTPEIPTMVAYRHGRIGTRTMEGPLRVGVLYERQSLGWARTESIGLSARTENTRAMAVDGRWMLTGGLTGEWVDFECGNIGKRRCIQDPGNSTGMAGDLIALGSPAVVDNDITLLASHLPEGSFGVFAASRMTGFTIDPAGSLGLFCLGSPSAFFLGPGQVQRTTAAGEIRIQLDLAAMPVAGGTVAVVPGDSWTFQAWYRDLISGPTSRFTAAVSVEFE